MNSPKTQPHPQDRGHDLKSTIHFIDPVLVEFIQGAMDRGTLHTMVPAEELAFTLTSIGSGLTTIWIIYGEGYPLERCVLRMRYFDSDGPRLTPWREIALFVCNDDAPKDIRYVHRRHKSAVEHLEEIVKTGGFSYADTD